MALLEIEHLSLAFERERRGGDAAPLTLEDVSLRVAASEFVTVLGPSGCGKTTMLRVAAGLERATAGRVVFDGAEVKKPGSDRVMVFQQPWLYPWLSVRDNVAFGLKLQGRKIDWAKVDQMLGVVGLSDFSAYPPYQLSGGMQQRAALARALVMSPKMLLMDEPFGALDAQTRRTLQQFLLRLWEEVRLAVMFVTHDVEEAILLGDRMFVMGTKPGCIALELSVGLPRPRDERMILDAHFLELRRQALDCLRDVALKASGIVTNSDSSGPAGGEGAPSADGAPVSAPAPLG
jgi:NitT/TauT family transport system ATP-binding protein